MATITTLIPPYLHGYVIELNDLTYNGVIYRYAVIDHRFGLVNGMSANFTCAKDGVIAVSDACPVEYRELYLFHEIVENADDHQDYEVCLRALKGELQLAKDRGLDMLKYVEDRLKFFADVVDYYESRKNTPEGLAIHIKAHRSLLYLRSLKMRSR